ncbi:hypothetical protein F2Q70_00020521 [Brassica cretica]|uniref:Transmembrane protein n=1 Tax=Brassica cretica TaxID=69181 RepID=A0A8S9GJU3_BRACR|nr:hypothetical protein F2Q70_00020521 [Brassica cretica]
MCGLPFFYFEKDSKMNEKLIVMELLKRAAKLLFSNINLAFFLFFSSLPLFCFLILFELSLQTTISLTYQFLSQELDLGGYFFLQDHKDLSENDLIPWLIQTSLLYFFPYTLLDLFTTTVIVAASSVSYTSGEEEPLGMLCLVQRSAKICRNRLVGCLITSLYVLLLSTSVFFGFFSDSVNYLFITSLARDYQRFNSKAAVLFHAVVVLIHGTVFIVLAVKFGKWSAGWNMGLVVSVLEEEEGEDGKGGIYGTNALSLSYWYGRGHEKRDLLMMLMFLVFAIATRMPCLYSRCSLSSSGNGVLYTGLYVGLICVGNAVKWVACVVSYYDCRARVLEKKDDVEIGSKAKGLAT